MSRYSFVLNGLVFTASLKFKEMMAWIISFFLDSVAEHRSDLTLHVFAGIVPVIAFLLSFFSQNKNGADHSSLSRKQKSDS